MNDFDNMPTRYVRQLAKEAKIKDWENGSIARLRRQLEEYEEDVEDTGHINYGNERVL